MQNLFDDHARFHEQPPIRIVEETGGLRHCVYRYEDVARALKTQNFGGTQTPPSILLFLRCIGLSALVNAARTGFLSSLDGPDHRRIRKVLDPAFSARKVHAHEQAIEAAVVQCLDRLDGRDRIDLVADFAAPLPAQVIADVFGFPPAEVDRIRRWTDDLVPLVESEHQWKALLRGLYCFIRFRRRVLNLVAERKDDPKEDLLSTLAEALYRSGTMTRDEIVGSAAFVLTAGHVTTRHLLSSSVLLLLQNPTALARAQQDEDIYETIIEEAIRLLGPLQTVARVATDTVELAGQDIPRGAKLRLYLGAANRDPGRFENPGDFVVDRSEQRHLGFGAGPHHCLGIHLARLEASIALRALFQRFPRLTLVEDGVEWGASRKFFGLSRLLLQTNAV